jgi:hypothetical protein
MSAELSNVRASTARGQFRRRERTRLASRDRRPGNVGAPRFTKPPHARGEARAFPQCSTTTGRPFPDAADAMKSTSSIFKDTPGIARVMLSRRIFAVSVPYSSVGTTLQRDCLVLVLRRLIAPHGVRQRHHDRAEVHAVHPTAAPVGERLVHAPVHGGNARNGAPAAAEAVVPGHREVTVDVANHRLLAAERPLWPANASVTAGAALVSWSSRVESSRLLVVSDARAQDSRPRTQSWCWSISLTRRSRRTSLDLPWRRCRGPRRAHARSPR